MKILRRKVFVEILGEKKALLDINNCFNKIFFEEEVVASLSDLNMYFNLFKCNKKKGDSFFDYLKTEKIDYITLHPGLEYSKKDIKSIQKNYKSFYFPKGKKTSYNLKYNDINFKYFNQENLKINILSENVILYKELYKETESFNYDIYIVDGIPKLFKRLRNSLDKNLAFVKNFSDEEIFEI